MSVPSAPTIDQTLNELEAACAELRKRRIHGRPMTGPTLELAGYIRDLAAHLAALATAGQGPAPQPPRRTPGVTRIAKSRDENWWG